jgi:hypothetical protein
MNNYSRSAVLLLIAVLAPASVSAALIDVSDVEITAFASYKTQLQPEKKVTVVKVVPRFDPTEAEALVLADGIPFPNLPNSQGQAFASAAGDGKGNFGVGVDGFFFRNSLPPNALEATVTMSQTITNNSDVGVGISANFFIPPPTLQFFGIGTSFPGGVDPARDAAAVVSARILTKLTHPDGSVVDDVPLDYGMRLFRDPVTGALFAIPTIDAEGELSSFVEPDGSFGFQLAFRLVDGLSLGTIGAGDTFEFTYEYLASASTGFGETGIFAAIGDPFELTVGAGRFELQVGAPPPPSAVPEPAALATFGLGLVALGIVAHRRRRPPLRLRIRPQANT